MVIMSKHGIKASFKHIKPENRASSLVGLIRAFTSLSDPIIAIDMIKETIQNYEEEQKNEGISDENRQV